MIELLVVIAIIAILMAILLPSLQAAKDQAKKTVCTAHVKGLVLALRMYADDHDGKTHDSPNHGLWDNEWQNPPVVKKYGVNDEMAYWGIAYDPYAKNKKIYACPSAQRVDDWPEWSGWGFPMQQYFKYCSYGLNAYITNKNIDHAFKRHAEVIAFQDHIEQLLDDNGDMFHILPGENINLTQWRLGWRATEFPNSVRECFRHRRVSVTSWLDGHVSEIEETTGEDFDRKWYIGR